MYGGLYVWTPRLPAPVKVRRATCANTIRRKMATRACSWTGRRRRSTPPTPARSSPCTRRRARRRLQRARDRRDVTLAQTAWRIADGRRARAGDGARRDRGRRGQGVAGDDVDGQVQLLSPGVNARSAMMTRAGDAVAWVEGANEIHVASSGRRRADGDHADGADPRFGGDDRSRTATSPRRARLATGPAALAKVTATGDDAAAGAEAAAILRVTSGARQDRSLRLLFARHRRRQRRARSVDARLRRAHRAAGRARRRASTIRSAPRSRFPTTAACIEYFDNFDPVTRRGDEYVVPLAKPTRSLVGTGVHNAAFIPGTTRLLYINAPDANTGAGVLTVLPSPTALPEVQSVGAVELRRLAPGSSAHLVHADDRRTRRRHLVHAAALIGHGRALASPAWKRSISAKTPRTRRARRKPAARPRAARASAAIR